jgi:fluoride exporter
MKLAFIVGLGSFIGGICRYLLSSAIQSKVNTGFPLGTLVVNLTGCFLIGCLYGLAERWNLSLEWRLGIVTGLLGGFTTFSAFSSESVHLLKTSPLNGGFYIAGSVVLGLMLTFAGIWLFRFTPGLSGN